MKNEKHRAPRTSAVVTLQVQEITDKESEQSDQRVQRRVLRWPTREQLWQWVPFLGIVLLGAILRFWGLGDKPLHHDESLHAYFSLQLMHNLENWQSCFKRTISCYKYDPLLHGPFQFHAIALMYKISQWLGAPEHGVNTTTVRLAAAISGTVIVGLPYLLRDYLGRFASWLACFLLAISPSMLYYSRFAREDIYMACFTLLLIVAVGRYMRDRRGGWLIVAALAFVLSYATKEATFLSIAVFGSFFVGLLVWELGTRIPVRARLRSKAAYVRYIPATAAPLGLVVLALLCAPLARWFFSWMKDAAIYITNNTAASDTLVQHLKDQTLGILPVLWIALSLCVLASFVYKRLRKRPDSNGSERTGLAKRVDPVRQPLLDALVTMPLLHWFCALLAGAALFVLLFSVFFTNFPQGIADGIWQGLYYWMKQQQVARGGQPWFYYLLLIPLYEQVGFIFGIAGIVRCLRHPSRFRLFLIYWLLGNAFIYSWAGEKMPWLVIHIVMPMVVLAALGLEPVVLRVVNLVKKWQTTTKNLYYRVQSSKKKNTRATIGTTFGALIAIVLVVLTLQNMFQVSYVHYADGPHEMLIYVQTTTDINIVMSKVETLDQQLYAGKHQVHIGVVPDANWPFYWYLRDYTNVCYGFPTSCAKTNPEVIITGGDNIAAYQSQYASDTVQGQASAFLFHQYHLRMWWDEGYKPAACIPGVGNTCEGQPKWGGIGPLLWLSYGDSPPAGAQFDPGLAITHIWQWWWERRAIGGVAGTTDMGLFIRKDLRMNP
ncbi:MAG: hypothetical protein PVS3B1_11580 [Ktedonobacteraceae bacterium]